MLAAVKLDFPRRQYDPRARRRYAPHRPIEPGGFTLHGTQLQIDSIEHSGRRNLKRLDKLFPAAIAMGRAAPLG